MITIYGSIMSPFVRKVLMALEFKGITYENKFMNPTVLADKQQLLKMSPLGKIPIYQEDAVMIPDSSVICAYVERRFSNKPLYPSLAESYVKALWYEEYADSELIEAIRVVYRNHPVIAPKLNLVPDVMAVTKVVDEKLPAMFSYLNNEISGSKYLVGNELSIADISIAAGFLNLELVGYKINDQRWSNLVDYLARIMEVDCVKKISTAAEKNFIERFGVLAAVG